MFAQNELCNFRFPSDNPQVYGLRVQAAASNLQSHVHSEHETTFRPKFEKVKFELTFHQSLTFCTKCA